MNENESIRTTISSILIFPFTKQDSAHIFHSKPSRANALISATGRIWQPHMVKIDSAAGPNLIDIELLKPEWRAHIQLCQHPRYIGVTGHSIRFHGLIPFYVELGDMRTRTWFSVASDLPPKVLLGNTIKLSTCTINRSEILPRSTCQFTPSPAFGNSKRIHSTNKPTPTTQINSSSL